MSKNNIIAGLDIGTSTVKCLVIQKKQNDCEFLAYAEVPSSGLRKGTVVNIEEVAKNIRQVILKVENDCGKKVNSVFVNIGGNHLRVIPSDGIISVSRADQIISKEDVARVLEATKAINLSKLEEVLDIIPKEFVIDGQDGIRDPLNLSGVRLEAKVLLLCYFQLYFTNLTQAVWNAKLQTNDIIASPVAAARSVLTPQQKEIGVALIDIGATTTSLAVFEEGSLVHLAIFPIGSANITNDIAIGLKTEVDIAESIKKQHGTCVFVKDEKKKEISKDVGHKKLEIFEKPESVLFTKKDLVDIIEPRVSEILDLVQKELKKIGKHKMLPGGIVLTGGGARLPKIKDLTRDVLELNCQIGIPKGIIGIDEDPTLATVAGLALEGVDPDEGVGIIAQGAFLKKIKKFLKNFIP